MDPVPQETQCMVCRRDYTPRTRENESSESISICRDCKSLVADDNESTPPVRNFRRRRSQHRIRSIRYSSSESIEDLFSQQFSQLINLVRQNQEIAHVEESDATVPAPPRPNYFPAYIETDRDSLFGESDSNFSFYGGDSETSEIFTHQDHESHFYTDTDIDPMHAGLDRWNSDDEDEDDGGEWEEVNIEEASIRLMSEHRQNQESIFSSPQNGTLFQWRVHQTDIFPNIDGRDFEELLEQLAENTDSRRGAPPASASVIEKLPNVVISQLHERNGALICAVCKDPLHVDTEAKQLPCMHLYHTACILPWLSARNSCPICRFELPTDDLEYEEGRRIRMQNQDENISAVSSDFEADDTQGEQIEDSAVNNSLNINRGNGMRWYFIAAAPVVSIVGIALAFWFGSSSIGERRVPCRIGEEHHRFQGLRGRRWWPFI